MKATWPIQMEPKERWNLMTCNQTLRWHLEDSDEVRTYHWYVFLRNYRDRIYRVWPIMKGTHKTDTYH
jgi:hypothetical protein